MSRKKQQPHHFDLDSDNEDDSVIHQDSDDDDDNAIQDDDVDIGFRRHHYTTFGEEDDDGVVRKKRQRFTKEDAIYGVFMEDDGKFNNKRQRPDNSGPATAPMFVSATKPEKTSPPQPPPTPGTAKDPNELGLEDDDDDGHDSKSPNKEKEAEINEEDIKIQEEQKKADDYFMSLLNKAKDPKQQRQRRPPTAPPPASSAPENSNSGHVGLGMLPTSFGRASMPDIPATPVVKKDKNIATWEKHTKGIGFKLLSKMGWAGQGGLGSNRRRKAPPPPESTATTTTAATSDTTAPTTPMSFVAATTVPEPTRVENSTTAPSRKGISRPVEVVVRPANMGLGFGNFKEASQLKTNRQIEAQVRGLPVEDDKKKKKKKKSFGDDDDDDDENVMRGPATTSSAIPSTNELLQHQSWKKWNKNKKDKSKKPKIIPYEELLLQQERRRQASSTSTEEQAPVIIDMRGPKAKDTSSSTIQQDQAHGPLLGEELLHNVSFLLNTHENQLHAASYMLKSSQRQVESLESEIQQFHHQQSEQNKRMQKIRQAMTTVEKVQEHLSVQKQQPDQQEELARKVQRLIQELGASFTAEERQSLQFWELLAPTLFSPVIQCTLQNWDPLGPLDETKRVLDPIFSINAHGNDTSQDHQMGQEQRSMDALRSSIIINQLIPHIKRVLESLKWDPSRDTYAALDLYEYLLEQASKQQRMNKSQLQNGHSSSVNDDGVFPVEEMEENHYETNSNAKSNEMSMQSIRKELMLDAIYPKLQGELSHWKPTLRNSPTYTVELERRLDLWILPWIPHLDHPAILPHLLSDCKRKLKSSISYLQRKTDNDLDFVKSALDTLKPWAKVYEPTVLQKLVSDAVAPNLARLLSKQKIRTDAKDQNWEGLDLTFRMHGFGLLSDIEFTSILESEFLTNWARKIHTMLLEDDCTPTEGASNYSEWKVKVLVQEQETNGKTVPPLDRSIKLLRDDSQICRIFYTVLYMIKLAQQANKKDELESLQPMRTNYHVSSARRAKDRQWEIQDDFVRMESRSASEVEARLRLRRRNVATPSFRDVVEEFAGERGILFQPKVGANSTKDGKQIFLFGRIPIIVEGDVIYMSKGPKWNPVSLDQLLSEPASKTSS